MDGEKITLWSSIKWDLKWEVLYVVDPSKLSSKMNIVETVKCDKLVYLNEPIPGMGLLSESKTQMANCWDVNRWPWLSE